MIHGCALAVLLQVLTLGGVASETPGICACAQAQEIGGWCDVDRVGFLAGVEIPSAYLFEVLDAHGHELDPASLDCDACRAAAATGAFCETHRIGFHEGKAYFSRLGHALARAPRPPVFSLDCPVCRVNAEDHGWCERCGVGRVGESAILDRAEYDAVVDALEILHRAVELAGRCEHCAAAAVTDTTCPVCKIRYVEGRPATATPPPGPVRDNGRSVADE